MKKFHKVTILVVFCGIILFISSCSLDFIKTGGRNRIIKEDMLTAGEIEAKMLDAVQYFEEGQLAKAQRVIKEILAERPDYHYRRYFVRGS